MIQEGAGSSRIIEVARKGEGGKRRSGMGQEKAKPALKTESQRCKSAHRCCSSFGSTIIYPSCGGRDGLEVGPARIDKVGEDLGPVVPLVPRDLRGGVDFDRHHLAHGSALDQYNRCADPARSSAAFFTTLDVCRYQWVVGGDVCAWDDVCALDGELPIGVT